MFSLFSILFLFTFVFAQNRTKCDKANFDWCNNNEIAASQGTECITPGHAPGTMGHTPGMNLAGMPSEDCSTMPDPSAVAACWERQNHAPATPGGTTWKPMRKRVRSRNFARVFGAIDNPIGSKVNLPTFSKYKFVPLSTSVLLYFTY
jgi:hypothetical protein